LTNTEEWVRDALNSGMECTLYTLKSCVLREQSHEVEGIMRRLVEEGWAAQVKKDKWRKIEYR
jgi:hypothetical protein